ncbi:MAG: DUF2062 domain-containing protein [Erythrobacter sp.]|uniref:DUF2062 domain-containing protein n=1 Tax=Erythrobacter sp. TaxID=1042 RepID=UPI0032EC6D28
MIREFLSKFRSKTWAADTIRRYMPTRDEMAKNRWLAPIAHRFLSPELWRFTRRSVPRGVALGLFSAFIIPLGQIFLAAFLALPARANVPLAALVTFITNPLTYAFWILVANRIGNFMLQIDAATAGYASGRLENSWWQAFVDFFQMAGVTVVGFLVMAIVSAALGYVLSSAVWRVLVARRRAKRLRLMEARLDRRLKAN